MSTKAAVRLHRLVTVGGRGVGKSALILQFTHSYFIDVYGTLFEDSYLKQCLIDDETAVLEVFDIPAHLEDSSIREQYIRDSDGFLLVYSITSRNSFDEINTFYQQIRRVKDRDFFPMILIGNKRDLHLERQVSPKEGRDLARQFQCPFIETSARNCINVDEAFFNVIREIRRYNREQGAGRSNSYGLPRAQSGGFGNTLEIDETKESSGCYKCVLM